MKILIIRLSSLGDIVLTQPITAELRRLYPKAQIHYLTKAAFAGLVGTFGTIDRIIPYDISLAFHLEQAHSGYDLVIDLHAKLASFLISLCVVSDPKSCDTTKLAPSAPGSLKST
jgi:ADP-heptose:LPS heptosyltransferase